MAVRNALTPRLSVLRTRHLRLALTLPITTSPPEASLPLYTRQRRLPNPASLFANIRQRLDGLRVRVPALSYRYPLRRLERDQFRTVEVIPSEERLRLHREDQTRLGARGTCPALSQTPVGCSVLGPKPESWRRRCEPRSRPVSPCPSFLQLPGC